VLASNGRRGSFRSSRSVSLNSSQVPTSPSLYDLPVNGCCGSVFGKSWITVNLFRLDVVIGGDGEERGLVDKEDEHAFVEFVGEFGDELLRIGVLLTSDLRLAEDVYQETLQRLAANWSQINNPRAFSRRVIHNVVVDMARSRSRRPRESQLKATFDTSDPSASDALTATEIRPALFAALDTLTPSQRAVVVLRYFDDRSESEVAELLGISVGSVKATASRAMGVLRAEPALAFLFDWASVVC
jgi:RNA polymerase sigma factor (sigma-70 family)